MTTQALQNISLIVGLLGIGFLGIGYLYSQFFKGKNQNVKSNSDIIENLQMQINGQDTIIKSLQDDMKRLKEQNIALIATSLEKDKSIQTYLDILQNRNPELEKILTTIQDSLKRLNKILDSQVQRENIIDNNTRTGEGKVMRGVGKKKVKPAPLKENTED